MPSPDDIFWNYLRLSFPWIVNGDPEEIDGYPLITLGYDSMSGSPIEVLGDDKGDAQPIYDRFFIE